MSSNHDLYLDLVAAKAVGSIEPADRLVLEDHLKTGCATCKQLEDQLGAPLEALAWGLPAARPAKGVKARVMVAVLQSSRADASSKDEVRGDAGDATSRAATWRWAVAAAALVVAALGWWRASALDGELATVRKQLAACEERCAPPSSPNAEYERFLARHPSARRLDLKPAAPDVDAARTARAAYDADARRAVLVFENFRAPAGRAFELWTIRGGAPVSEGLIETDADGRAFVVLDNVGDPKALGAFAVSLEAEGGSPNREAPAGPVQYVAPTS
jgi:anti-sigma-K factor RskA